MAKFFSKLDLKLNKTYVFGFIVKYNALIFWNTAGLASGAAHQSASLSDA